jgi:hypothetical protein
MNLARAIFLAATTSGIRPGQSPPALVVLTLVRGLFSMPAMSVLFEINRDFPYQVALSFDEAAMDVLDWLEECDFEWDMYVDLPENTVRYCFRSVGDAAAFKRRFGHAAQRRAVAGGH